MMASLVLKSARRLAIFSCILAGSCWPWRCSMRGLPSAAAGACAMAPEEKTAIRPESNRVEAERFMQCPFKGFTVACPGWASPWKQVWAAHVTGMCARGVAV